MTADYTPTSVLRDRGPHPLAPSDVARAVLLSDESLYEELVAGSRPDALHRAGVWHLLAEQAWTPAAAQAAHALRALLGPVRHPLARTAIAALDEGISHAGGTALPLRRTEQTPARAEHAA